MPQGKGARLFALDAIRGVAVMMIICWHVLPQTKPAAAEQPVLDGRQPVHVGNGSIRQFGGDLVARRGGAIKAICSLRSWFERPRARRCLSSSSRRSWGRLFAAISAGSFCRAHRQDVGADIAPLSNGLSGDGGPRRLGDPRSALGRRIEGEAAVGPSCQSRLSTRPRDPRFGYWRNRQGPLLGDGRHPHRADLRGKDRLFASASAP